MTKQIEDHPELDKWLDDVSISGGECSSCEYYVWHESVAEKLLEQQAKIDSLAEQLKDRESRINGYINDVESLTGQNKELQEQVNFKIEECITLAKACNRWKETALNKESK